MMLVVGGNKTASISQQPLLSWYHKMFQTRLRSPGARLMVVGYSFGDAHINQMIFSGIEAGLKIFIIDPQGRIAKHYASVDPKGHSQMVLADLKALQGKTGGS